MTNEDLTKHVLDLDERVTRHTEQIKTCFNQIADLKDMAESLKELAFSVRIMAHDLNDMGKKVDTLAAGQKEIKERPAKRWDTVVSCALTAFVTALVAYVLTQLGLKN